MDLIGLNIPSLYQTWSINGFRILKKIVGIIELSTAEYIEGEAFGIDIINDIPRREYRGLLILVLGDNNDCHRLYIADLQL